MIGTMKHKFGFNPRYIFYSASGQILYEILGTFWKKHFDIYKNGQCIANISRKLFSIRDTFGIQISASTSDQEAMLILMIVAVINHVIDQQRNNNSNS